MRKQMYARLANNLLFSIYSVLLVVFVYAFCLRLTENLISNFKQHSYMYMAVHCINIFSPSQIDFILSGLLYISLTLNYLKFKLF